VALFQEATEIDPGFSTAYAMLSQARMWLFWNFPGARDQAELSAEALDRAIELAPNAVETRLAQGYFYYWGRGDSQEALRHFTAAEEIKPSDTNVITAIGLILRGEGRWEEAVAAFQRAQTYDYRSFNLAYLLGETNVRMRRWQDAEEYLERAWRLAPDGITAYRDLLRVRLASTGDTVAARRFIRDLPTTTPAPVLALLEADLAYYRGDPQRTLELMTSEALSLRGRAEVSPTAAGGSTHERLALLYELLGDRERRNAHADSLRIRSQAILDAVAANPGPMQTGVVARAHAKLGLAYALLGESIKAVAEGSTAASSLSVQDDAYAGAEHLRDLVLIYILIGATDLAAQEVQTALSIPSPLSRVELTLDPVFQPLREHPMYRELLASAQ
jgi:tetratricopeptide (TPR) repeat protein